MSMCVCCEQKAAAIGALCVQCHEEYEKFKQEQTEKEEHE